MNKAKRKPSLLKRLWGKQSKCVNCGEVGSCCCWRCLRAMAVPLVIAEVIRRVFA